MKKTTFKSDEYVYSNSFEPNLTSNLIADTLENIDVEDKDILDLGCGCGALGLSLIKSNPKSVLLADISTGAIDDCNLNIKNHTSRIKKIKVSTMVSDCFNKIPPNKKYDLIINDISGISEDVASLSPWFNNAPCNSDANGLKFFKKVIIEAEPFLKEEGILASPLISLSNINEARSFLDDKLKNYTTSVKKNWFLPEDMNEKYKSILEEQVDIGNICLDYKFGKFIAWTQVLLIKKGAYK
jgi:SAM-dependent methyltransferase